MTPFPETRESLIVQVKASSNRLAWERFVAIYQPVIYRIAIARGLQDADAHDLTQQVFMAVARAIPSWERSSPSARFHHWLRRVTCKAIINAVTRRKVELEVRRELYAIAAETVRVEVHPVRIMRLFDLKKRFGCNGKEEGLAESVRHVVWEVPTKINGKETFAIGPLHDLHYIAPCLSYEIVRSERHRFEFNAELCRIEEAADYSLTEMSEFECPTKNDICLPRVITRHETISDKRYAFKTVIDKWEINEDVNTTRRESK